MGLDAENSCIYITKIISLKEVSESTLGKSFGFLTNPTTTLNNPNKKSNDIIKYVMDKYKQENHSSEDNSTNENIENNEDTKNISNNPFLNDGD